MDPVTARFKVLKLAALCVEVTPDPDKVLEVAKKWSEFVCPAPPRESKGGASKGADAETPLTHVP